jgi:hypothetical protein
MSQALGADVSVNELRSVKHFITPIMMRMQDARSQSQASTARQDPSCSPLRVFLAQSPGVVGTIFYSDFFALGLEAIRCLEFRC